MDYYFFLCRSFLYYIERVILQLDFVVLIFRGIYFIKLKWINLFYNIEGGFFLLEKILEKAICRVERFSFILLSV